MERILINRHEVENLLINQGFKKEEIRQRLYPQLSKSQWAKAINAMGLKAVRARKVEFEIVDTVTVTATAPSSELEGESTSCSGTMDLASGAMDLAPFMVNEDPLPTVQDPGASETSPIDTYQY